MNKISISTTFELSSFKEIEAFFKVAYRDDIAISAEDIFRWQYGKDRQDDLANLIVARIDDEIIGSYGYVPVKTFWGDFDKPITLIYGINWYVLPKYTAVGWGLVRKAMKMADGILSLQQTENTSTITKAANWFIGDDIPRLVCILDKQKTQNALGEDLSFIEKQISSNNTPCELDDTFAPDWKQYRSLQYSIVRNYDFLKWRYLDHPEFDYKVFLHGSSKSPAVCVFRTQKTFGDFTESIVKIIDFFYPETEQGEEHAKELLDIVLGYCKEDGCIYADFVTSATKYRDFCLNNGFYIDEKGLLPSRVTPVQKIKEQFNFLYQVKNDKNTTMPDICITRGDSDIDRLVSLNHRAKD
jgi:hypothetical protein